MTLQLKTLFSFEKNLRHVRGRVLQLSNISREIMIKVILLLRSIVQKMCKFNAGQLMQWEMPIMRLMQETK